MSALPKAVQEQVKRANQLADDLKNAGKPAPANEPEAPKPDEPGAPPSTAQQPQGGDPESSASAPAPADPPSGAPADPVDWEHKFKVLQGKYNAEVPRLTKQAKEQGEQLQDLRQQLTNTQSLLASLNENKPPPQPQAGSPPATPTQRLVKDDEIREFGSDLYDFVKRAAMEAVSPKLAELTKPFEERLSKTEQSTQHVVKTAEQAELDKMYGLLDAKVPNWVEINEQPEFLQWLAETDPYTGAQRGQLLAQAHERRDGPRVLAFFQGFLNENAAVTPPAGAAPAAGAPPSEGAPPAQPEGQPLDGLVAPGTPKSGPQSGAPDEAGKRVWTQAQIRELYLKKNEYTKKGRKPPKELEQLEVDLIKAQSEGRVRV